MVELVNDPAQQQALADAIKAHPELLFKAAEHAVGKPHQAVDSRMRDGLRGARNYRLVPASPLEFVIVSLSKGTRLGPYEIAAPLGAGGMGEVYKARDTRLERDVAIKVLPEHLKESPEQRRRFEHEAKSLSQLQHPNLCALFDVGSEDGVELLVMELLDARPSPNACSQGPLTIGEVLRIGGEIAKGIAAAHRKGFVHRDLKPGSSERSPIGSIAIWVESIEEARRRRTGETSLMLPWLDSYTSFHFIKGAVLKNDAAPDDLMTHLEDGRKRVADARGGEGDAWQRFLLLSRGFHWVKEYPYNR